MDDPLHKSRISSLIESRTDPSRNAGRRPNGKSWQRRRLPVRSLSCTTTNAHPRRSFETIEAVSSITSERVHKTLRSYSLYITDIPVLPSEICYSHPWNFARVQAGLRGMTRNDLRRARTRLLSADCAECLSGSGSRPFWCWGSDHKFWPAEIHKLETVTVSRRSTTELLLMFSRKILAEKSLTRNMTIIGGFCSFQLDFHSRF